MIKKSILAIVVVSLLIPFFSIAQCRNLEFEDGVNRKLITADLFDIQIDSDFLGCPKFLYGDSALCGKVVNSKGKWDIGLPDGLLFTVLFDRTHYNHIKHILKDSFFINSLKDVPYPSADAMEWFEKRIVSKTFLLQIPESAPIDTPLDEIQKKLLSVYYSVNSWTFCPEEKQHGLLNVHGVLDNKNNVVIYNTACRASNVYQSNISEAALTFRLFFVVNHEFSHALDRSSGVLPSLPNSSIRDLCEKRANINGLIMTRAFAELFQQKLIETKTAIQKCSSCLPCDKAFLNQTIRRWERVDDFFVSKIEAAKKNLSEGNNVAMSHQEVVWSSYACMEPKVLEH